jgi:hypothetical protein
MSRHMIRPREVVAQERRVEAGIPIDLQVRYTRLYGVSVRPSPPRAAGRPGKRLARAEMTG